MLNYSEFIVGLWFVPVVLCIFVPLAMLGMWSIKHMIEDIYASVKRVEGAVTESNEETTGDIRPHAAA